MWKIMAQKKPTLRQIKTELEFEILPYRRQQRKDLDPILTRAKKHRKDCLIAKSSGFAGNAFGTTLTMVGLGIVLIPVTAGLSQPLIMAGIAIATLGGITTASTKIAGPICGKKFIKLLQNMESEFGKKFSSWIEALQRDKGLVDLLRIRGDSKHRKMKKDDIQRWLKLRLYKDKPIVVDDLKPGDHILRRGNLSGSALTSAFYHHGICVDLGQGPVIVDFGLDSTPKVRSIAEFVSKDKKLYVRDYMGWELPLPALTENVKLLIENGFSNYHFWNNNCEHFATHIKLGIPKPWSSQIRRAEKFASKVVNIIYTYLTVTGFGVAPYAPLFEASMLKRDFEKQDKIVEFVESAMLAFDENIAILENYLQVLNEQSYENGLEATT